MMYGEDVSMKIEDRLQELEDIKREVEIIADALRIASERQKFALLAEGMSFTYQQGVLDTVKTIKEALEGKTNFHAFMEDAKAQYADETKQASDRDADVV